MKKSVVLKLLPGVAALSPLEIDTLSAALAIDPLPEQYADFAAVKEEVSFLLGASAKFASLLDPLRGPPTDQTKKADAVDSLLKQAAGA